MSSIRSRFFPRTARGVLAALVPLALTAASATLAACSSDDSTGNNPTPEVHDSGIPSADTGAAVPDTGTATTPGTDAGSESPDSGGDALPPIDANLPDTGCQSDATTCNSCFTPVQDPVNGCSAAAVNCTKFDNSRVPANAP